MSRCGECVSERVRPRHVQRARGHEQLHFMPYRSCVPRLVAHATRIMSCRVCVQCPWTEPTSIDVPRGLLLFRRHFNTRPRRSYREETAALPAGHVLFGRRGPQPDDALDPRGAGRRVRSPEVYGGNVLPGRFADGDRFPNLLCRSLLSAWKYVSRASASRKFFRCRGRRRADDVFSGNLRRFDGGACLCGVSCWVLVSRVWYV